MSLKDHFRIQDRKPRAGAAATAPESPAPVLREKEDDGSLLGALLAGKEIVKEFQTGYGTFEFRYPSGADQLAVARRRAAYLGGFPDSSYDNARRLQFEMWATLDILITRKPAPFDEMGSWADCPDQTLVDDLYERGSVFCREIRKEIGESRPGPHDGGPGR